MVWGLQKTTGLPRNRVVGMAGVSHTSRYRYFLAEGSMSAENITAMVLGGHGDTMVPFVRFTTMAGIPSGPGADAQDHQTPLDAMVQRTREAAPRSSKCQDRERLLRPGRRGMEMAEVLSQKQEERAALRRLARRRIWRQGPLCRRAGRDQLQRRRACHRARADFERAAMPS